MTLTRIHLTLGDHHVEYFRRRRRCISALVRSVIDGMYAAGELERTVNIIDEAARAEYIEAIIKGAKHRGKRNRREAPATPHGKRA